MVASIVGPGFDDAPGQRDERGDAAAPGPQIRRSKASLPASPLRKNTSRRPSLSRWARCSRGSVLAIQASLACWSSVRFRGFFHNA